MSPGRSFDDLAHLYDGSRGGELRGSRYADDLRAYLRAGDLVFEVGVGTGVVALGLSRLGFPVAGCDLSTAMLAEAHRRLPGRVVAGDAMLLPVRDGVLWNALSVWVLHLVDDPSVVMREVARALRPGGRYVVVAEPARAETPADAVGAILAEMIATLEALGSRRRRRDAREVLVPAASDAGLAVMLETLTPPQTFSEAPAHTADMHERRAFSWMDGLSDEHFRDVVVPAVQRLRSLPDPHEPVDREASRHRVFVFERPA